MESGPEELPKVLLMAAAAPGSSTESLSVCFFTTKRTKKNNPPKGRITGVNVWQRVVLSKNTNSFWLYVLKKKGEFRLLFTLNWSDGLDFPSWLPESLCLRLILSSRASFLVRPPAGSPSLSTELPQDRMNLFFCLSFNFTVLPTGSSITRLLSTTGLTKWLTFLWPKDACSAASMLNFSQQPLTPITLNNYTHTVHSLCFFFPFPYWRKETKARG